MDFIKNQLDGNGMSEQTIGYLSNMIMVVFIAVVSILANFITKKIVLKTIIHIVNNNRYTWDNIIVEKKCSTSCRILCRQSLFIFRRPSFRRTKF